MCGIRCNVCEIINSKGRNKMECVRDNTSGSKRRDKMECVRDNTNRSRGRIRWNVCGIINTKGGIRWNVCGIIQAGAGAGLDGMCAG